MAVRAPARPSESHVIRDWVDALPARSVFRTEDVPASIGVNSTLSKLAARPNAPLERIVKGIYSKREMYPDGDYGGRVDLRAIAVRHLGPGAGYAPYSALLALGWSTQMPVSRWFVGVTPAGGRLRKPPRPDMRYVGRRNQRRLRLSFEEVTLLEGIRGFLRSELPWTDAVWDVVSGRTAHKIGPGGLLRPEALRWAARGEPPQIRPMMVEMVDEYASQMPGVVAYQQLPAPNSEGEIVLPRKPKSFLAERQKQEKQDEFWLPAMLHDSAPTNKAVSFKFASERVRQLKAERAAAV